LRGRSAIGTTDRGTGPVGVEGHDADEDRAVQGVRRGGWPYDSGRRDDIRAGPIPRLGGLILLGVAGALPLAEFLAVGFPGSVLVDGYLRNLVDDEAGGDDQRAKEQDVGGGDGAGGLFWRRLAVIVLDVVQRFFSPDGLALGSEDGHAVRVGFQGDAEDFACPLLGLPVLAQAAGPVVGHACVEKRAVGPEESVEVLVHEQSVTRRTDIIVVRRADPGSLV
jgi:hypothetical protein